VNETTSAIASVVEENGTATCEIVNGVSQAAEGISEVSSNIAARATEIQPAAWLRRIV
jgi:methyl-accepting chemotaxis protein